MAGLKQNKTKTFEKMLVLEVEPRDLFILDKCSITELGGWVWVLCFNCGRVLLHNSGLPRTLGLLACFLSIGIQVYAIISGFKNNIF